MAHFPAKVSACVSAVQGALHIDCALSCASACRCKCWKSICKKTGLQLCWDNCHIMSHDACWKIPGSLHLALLRWTAFLQEMTSAILGGTSEPAEGASIPIQTQDLSWVQDIWFAILDSTEASPETFLASGEALKPYQDSCRTCGQAAACSLT